MVKTRISCSLENDMSKSLSGMPRNGGPRVSLRRSHVMYNQYKEDEVKKRHIVRKNDVHVISFGFRSFSQRSIGFGISRFDRITRFLMKNTRKNNGGHRLHVKLSKPSE